MSECSFFGLTPHVIGSLIIARGEQVGRTTLPNYQAARPFTHALVLSRMTDNIDFVEAAALWYALDDHEGLPILYDNDIRTGAKLTTRRLGRFNPFVTEEQWRSEQERRLKYLRMNRGDDVMSVLMSLWVVELLEYAWGERIGSKRSGGYLKKNDIHWFYFTEDVIDIYDQKFLIHTDDRPAIDEWRALVISIMDFRLR